MSVELSVVIPMFNEEAVLPSLVDRLRPVLDGLSVGEPTLPYEVVCVDDGSRDGTGEQLLRLATDWPQLRVIRLLRNSGHQAALTAGLVSARGAYAVTLDADLQDPPEVISEMLAVARSQGVDVVYGVRSDRSSDSVFKRSTASAYYRLMRRLSGPQLPDNAGDFRLVSRRVVDALAALPEHGRVYRLVIPWFGFPSATVPYKRDARAAGNTKYPFTRMLALAFDSIASFSALPLRFATWAGLVGTLISILAIGWSLLGWVTGHTVPGWTSLLAAFGLVGAIQLVCLGLLGEYVARIFMAGQQRPTFLIGFDSHSGLGPRPLRLEHQADTREPANREPAL